MQNRGSLLLFLHARAHTNTCTNTVRTGIPGSNNVVQAGKPIIPALPAAVVGRCGFNSIGCNVYEKRTLCRARTGTGSGLARTCAYGLFKINSFGRSVSFETTFRIRFERYYLWCRFGRPRLQRYIYMCASYKRRPNPHDPPAPLPRYRHFVWGFFSDIFLRAYTMFWYIEHRESPAVMMTWRWRPIAQRSTQLRTILISDVR